MTEKILYYCGQPTPEQVNEWWVLLSPESIVLLANLSVLTGKPVEWITACAIRDYCLSVGDWLDSHEVINAVPEETP